MLKQSETKSKSQSLSTQFFYVYFKTIIDPYSVFYQADEDIIHFNERFFEVRSELQVMFNELDDEITINEIIKAIKQCKPNKSGGPDILLNEFFFSSKNSPYLHKF